MADLVFFTGVMESGKSTLALQVTPLCWCGAQATTNTRTLDGFIVTEGDQKLVGDVAVHDGSPRGAPGGADPIGVVAYEVPCRKHYRTGTTRRVVGMGSAPEPLPIDPDQEVLTPDADSAAAAGGDAPPPTSPQKD